MPPLPLAFSCLLAVASGFIVGKESDSNLVYTDELDLHTRHSGRAHANMLYNRSSSSSSSSMASAAALASTDPHPFDNFVVCGTGSIPHVPAIMKVKVGTGDYEERRIVMREIHFSWGSGDTFNGIGILVWPQNTEPGDANIENVKLQAIASLDAFNFDEKKIRYKGEVLVLRKSEGKNKRTKATVGETAILKIQPREHAKMFKGEKKNRKQNYYAMFVQLDLCLEGFKKMKAGSKTFADLMDELKKNDQLFSNLVQATVFSKEGGFGGLAIQKMKKELEKLQNKPPDSSDAQQVECYDRYLKWNGKNFKHVEDDFDFGQEAFEKGMLDTFKSTKDTIEFVDFSTEKKEPSLEEYLETLESEGKTTLEHEKAREYYAGGFIQMFNKKQMDEDHYETETIRFSISPKMHDDERRKIAGYDDAKDENDLMLKKMSSDLQPKESNDRAKLAWEVIKEILENKDSKGAQIVSRGLPLYIKTQVPFLNKARHDAIIVQYVHLKGPKKGSDDFKATKERILENMKTYDELCKYIKAKGVEKFFTDSLPPFQFRKKGCPLSVSSYCGDNSFGKKLCGLLVPNKKGETIDGNLIKYADHGYPMEKSWTFSDWMNCDGAMDWSRYAHKGK